MNLKSKSAPTPTPTPANFILSGSLLMDRMILSMALPDLLASIDPEVREHPIAKERIKGHLAALEAGEVALLGRTVIPVLTKATVAYRERLRRKGAVRKDGLAAAVASATSSLQLSDVTNIGDPANFGVSSTGEPVMVHVERRTGDLPNGTKYDQDVLVVQVVDPKMISKVIRAWETVLTASA